MHDTAKRRAPRALRDPRRMLASIACILAVVSLTGCEATPNDILEFLAGCPHNTRSAAGAGGSYDAKVVLDNAHYTPPEKSDNPTIEAAAEFAEAWALDDANHGYSMNRRASDQDTDCSGLVFKAWQHAAPQFGFTGWPFVTWNMGPRLEAVGFRHFRWSGNPADAAASLKRGDVVVATGGGDEHTEMYVGGGMFVGARHACPSGSEDGQVGDQCTGVNQEIGIGNNIVETMVDAYRYTESGTTAGGSQSAGSTGSGAAGGTLGASNAPEGTDPTDAAWMCKYRPGWNGGAGTTSGGTTSEATYTGDGTHATPEQAKSIARQMIASGYKEWDNDTEYQCLVWVWEHESGWRWNAENPSSGAYGIPQSLPASKMASAGADWHDNAGTQIKWGLQYIKGRYGSPCQTKSFWQANNWY